MIRLKTLKIKNCRGVRNGPDLIFESGGLFICGDNGTGKSSYIDAIEKVLTGKCGSLEGVQGISWTNHAQHIKSSSGPDIELIITDGNREHTINLDSDLTSTPEYIQNYVNSAKECSFLLRRKTILKFVNSQPNERYKAIEGFLNLDSYKQFEIWLKKLEQDTKIKIEDLIQKVNSIKKGIEITLQYNFSDSFNDDALIAKINEKTTTVGLPEITSFEEIENLKSKIESDIKQLSDTGKSQVITQLFTLIEKIPDFNNLKENITDHLIKYEEFLHTERDLKGHFYSEILENGVKWIQEDSLTRCPLCNNEINPKEVVIFVNQKISENKNYLDIKFQYDQSKNDIGKILLFIIEWISSIENNLHELGEESPPESLKKVHSTLIQINDNIKESLSIEQLSEDNKKIVEMDFIGSILECKKIVEEKKRIIDENRLYQTLIELKTCITYIQIHYPQYKSIYKKLNYWLKIQKNLLITINLAEQGRKDAVQKFIYSIGTKADSYFQKIHPDESIGNPQLLVSDRGTGSIVLESSFYDQLGDPRGYYSEGHLDSLGLCLFLAIRDQYKQKNPDFSLLILDDVLHSIDGQHRLATAQLLFNEFSHYQIIITTHDRLWFENLKLVSNNQSYNKNMNSTWSIEDGPGFGDNKSNYEWLLSPEGIGANPADKVIKAGRLLEEMLQNLCDSLTIKIPYKLDGSYTIAPLWENFYSKIKKSTLYSQYQVTFDNIDLLRVQRNWIGAHFNIWANGLTAEESNQFVKSVVNIFDVVYCMNCNRYIKRIPELIEGTWRCKCEQLRYDKNNI